MNDKLPLTIDFDNPTMIETLKATVAQGTTDAEFLMFVEFCKATGLNPFKRELWCIVLPEKTWIDQRTGYDKKRERKFQIMAGINGFYEIANSEPQFDGLEHGLLDPQGIYQPLSYPKDDFIGAWARVYRKDRRIPQEEVAFLSEYDQKSGNWLKMKRIMILKCADSLALRKGLPQKLNGLYVEEEVVEEIEDNTDSRYLHSQSKVQNILDQAQRAQSNILTLPEVKAPVTMVAETLGTDDVAMAPVAEASDSQYSFDEIPPEEQAEQLVQYRIPFEEKDRAKPLLRANKFQWNSDLKVWEGPQKIVGFDKYLTNE